MAGPGTPSERRDDRATDRDAAAERRDGDSLHRDVAADRRDTGALGRDDRSADRLEALRERLTRLRAQVPEQGRLAALDGRALLGMLDDVGDELRRAVKDRVASARDRDSSAADRQASERDRTAAAADRVASAGDRDQATIEREQADPADREATDPADPAAVVDESVLGRMTRAVQDSRRRVIDSRRHLGSTRGGAGGAPAAPDSAGLAAHTD